MIIMCVCVYRILVLSEYKVFFILYPIRPGVLINIDRLDQAVALAATNKCKLCQCNIYSVVKLRIPGVRLLAYIICDRVHALIVCKCEQKLYYTLTALQPGI